MKRTVLIIAGLLVMAIAWFLGSPLFIDRVVDEELDFVLDGGDVDMDAVMAMTDEKRLTMRDEIMDAAASAPDAVAAEPMPTSGPTVVAMGQFSDADAVHKGSGLATLYQFEDGRNLLRFEEFRVTNGPALVVYLAKHPAPTSAADVTDGGFVKLGELKGNIGNQNYEIPAGVNVSDFGSVVIWCELFGVLFSPASLAGS